jgi:hypothetical protein
MGARATGVLAAGGGAAPALGIPGGGEKTGDWVAAGAPHAAHASAPAQRILDGIIEPRPTSMPTFEDDVTSGRGRGRSVRLDARFSEQGGKGSD